MKYFLIFLFSLFFSTSLFAIDFEISHETITSPDEIFDFISTPKDELERPHCVAFYIRQRLSNHDLLIATGHKISRIEKYHIMQNECGKHQFFYKIDLHYSDNYNKESKTSYSIKCILKR